MIEFCFLSWSWNESHWRSLIRELTFIECSLYAKIFTALFHAKLIANNVDILITSVCRWGNPGEERWKHIHTHTTQNITALKKLTEPGFRGAIRYWRWLSYTSLLPLPLIEREEEGDWSEGVRWSKVDMEIRAGIRN